MKALLLRVGIDSTDGGWQAPVSAETGESAYVPITEDRDGKPPRRGFLCRFDEFIEPVANLGAELPTRLLGEAAHLDPDFEYLTYGDQGSRAPRIRNQRPARVASIPDPGADLVARRWEMLDAYPWSSWRVCGGRERAPGWW